MRVNVIFNGRVFTLSYSEYLKVKNVVKIVSWEVIS